MVVTLGQQCNVGEKSTVILYTYINRHAGTTRKTAKTKTMCSTSNMVLIVIIYFYIGCKYISPVVMYLLSFDLTEIILYLVLW